MDTTESDAAALPANDDCTDELGDLLVNQESFRGGFSRNLVDHRLPCTASNDTKRQIVASIPKWNEILSWIELELCELPGEGSQLELVHVRNICHVRPEGNQIRQAAAMLYWLLKTHRCVESVQIPQYIAQYIDDPVMAYWCSVVICCTLSGNDSVKFLTFVDPLPLKRERIREVLLSMKRLEELNYAVFSPDNVFLEMVSELLRAPETLTVLDFTAPFGKKVQNELLLKALTVNFMLRDLTLCAPATLAQSEFFLEFMSGTNVLKHLKVFGFPCEVSGDAMKLIFQGMLENVSVSSLEAHDLSLDGEIVKRGATMLAQSKVLQTSRLWHCFTDLLGLIDFIDTASWLKAISNNDTLKHLTLGLNIRTSGCREQLFHVLARQGSRKMATLVTDKYDHDRLVNIANKLEEIGCEEKVTFVGYYTGDSISLADCTRITPNCLRILGPRTFVRSIIDLSLGVHVEDHREGVQCLGQAVAQSNTIRKLRLFGWLSSASDRFLRGVHPVIFENYALCHVDVGFGFPCSLSEAQRLTIVLDVARRNCGYVARAARFLHCKRCDTPCAAALDRVRRHAALVAELSKVLSISVADAKVAVSRRFRSIKGMHEFMRLAGVVKTHVTCQPRDDGCTQLDALDEQCWALLRRYLQLDDVVWQCPSSTNVISRVRF
ncbi:hypothetical protein MRX96_016932 [Rhipicephalus microplus]